MNKRNKTNYSKVITAILVIGVSVFAFNKAGDAVQKSTGQEKEKITRVDARYVCMVNNKLFQKEQIPVVVDGKTYYGCCQMCKKTLNDKPGSRMAIDPVSDKIVDKATAIIGALPNGTVYYFESEKNLKRFSNNRKRK